MKIQSYLIFGLIVAIAVIFLLKDAKINSLQEEFNAFTPDTITVTLTIRDTLIVHIADTTYQEYEVIGDTVFVYKVLVDTVVQPLFQLVTRVNSRTERYHYDFKYRPLIVSLAFNDKYDLRKGFEVSTTPNIGTVNVDWGSYEPIKKKKFSCSLGLAYSKEVGPMLLGGIHFKKNELGMFLKEGSYGIYFKRMFISF
jgi:hypothetical protein